MRPRSVPSPSRFPCPFGRRLDGRRVVAGPGRSRGPLFESPRNGVPASSLANQMACFLTGKPTRKSQNFSRRGGGAPPDPPTIYLKILGGEPRAAEKIH